MLAISNNHWIISLDKAKKDEEEKKLIYFSVSVDTLKVPEG